EGTPQPAGNTEPLVATLVGGAVDEVPPVLHPTERERPSRLGADRLRERAGGRRVEQRKQLGRGAVALRQTVVGVDQPRAVQRGRPNGIVREARAQSAGVERRRLREEQAG